MIRLIVVASAAAMFGLLSACSQLGLLPGSDESGEVKDVGDAEITDTVDKADANKPDNKPEITLDVIEDEISTDANSEVEDVVAEEVDHQSVDAVGDICVVCLDALFDSEACSHCPMPCETSCEDDDPCTTDYCDTATGMCKNMLTPNANPETCNGKDDDCDGDTDEIPVDLCPDGQTCVGGQCEALQLTDGFQYIPAGNFWMGSPQGTICPSGYPGVCKDEASSTYNDDEALHYVKLTYPFEMQIHEVSQDEFTTVMGWNPSHFGPNGSGEDCGIDCPVERVSWYDAVAYANEKSKTSNPVLTPCYVFSAVQCEDGTTHGNQYMACMNVIQGGIKSAIVTLNGVGKPFGCTGYRLPTESEWEYAIRAGSHTAFYPSDGNDGTITYESACDLPDPNLVQISWYCGNSDDETHPVGLNDPSPREPNAWSLYDMSGNVWEWVWDWYPDSVEKYPAGTISSPAVDPVGSVDGPGRVKRGGSWNNNAHFCRSADRTYQSPGNPNSNLGFRLSRTLGEFTCTPDCEAKECGDDGCGGFCECQGKDVHCFAGKCRFPRSCAELHSFDPSVASGYHWIEPINTSQSSEVWCDMETAGGGWMRCAVIDYEKDTSTSAYGIDGSLLGGSSADATLGIGTTAAVKASCFDYYSNEDGFMFRHDDYCVSPQGQFDFVFAWTFTGADLGNGQSFALIPGGSCWKNGGWEGDIINVPASVLESPDLAFSNAIFTLGPGTDGCQEAGLFTCENGPKGSAQGFWTLYPCPAGDSSVQGTYIELADQCGSGLGVRSCSLGIIEECDGQLEFYVRTSP